MEPEHKIVFLEGCMWEGGSWEIVFDCKCDISGDVPCKHCTDIHCDDSGRWKRYQCTCPRVVVAYNECGQSSTGMCLDCVLEAAAQIDNGEVRP